VVRCAGVYFVWDAVTDLVRRVDGPSIGTLGGQRTFGVVMIFFSLAAGIDCVARGKLLVDPVARPEA